LDTVEDCTRSGYITIVGGDFNTKVGIGGCDKYGLERFIIRAAALGSEFGSSVI
jgi:hypothetical protein